MKLFACALVVPCAFWAAFARAQEIQLTGPLCGSSMMRPRPRPSTFEWTHWAGLGIDTNARANATAGASADVAIVPQVLRAGPYGLGALASRDASLEGGLALTLGPDDLSPLGVIGMRLGAGERKLDADARTHFAITFTWGIHTIPSRWEPLDHCDRVVPKAVGFARVVRLFASHRSDVDGARSVTSFGLELTPAYLLASRGGMSWLGGHPEHVQRIDDRRR